MLKRAGSGFATCITQKGPCFVFGADKMQNLLKKSYQWVLLLQ